MRCNYLLVYEYVIGNQTNNPWKNIARALATKHLERTMEDEDEGSNSGRSTPEPSVNKSQDRTLLLGGMKICPYIVLIEFRLFYRYVRLL